jgi:hypothetical protein
MSVAMLLSFTFLDEAVNFFCAWISVSVRKLFYPNGFIAWIEDVFCYDNTPLFHLDIILSYSRSGERGF